MFSKVPTFGRLRPIANAAKPNASSGKAYPRHTLPALRDALLEDDSDVIVEAVEKLDERALRRTLRKALATIRGVYKKKTVEDDF